MNTDYQNPIRAALRGQRLLIVGGDRREHAIERLRKDLGLLDVAHCATRSTDASPRTFDARLREPGLVLVVWVLGLSRTHHGTYLHRTCRTLGVPWVDCSRIPHPSALVACIERLRLAGALWRRRGQIAATA